MKLSIKEIAVFSMLSALMFSSKVLMEVLPNIHLLGTFIVTFTVVYRQKALYPIYGYVLVNGLYEGFNPFGWLPELYLWAILWGVVMLLPKNMPAKIKPVVYMTVSGLHGLLFGVFYAPVYAIFAKLSLVETFSWVVAGLGFDALHGAGNFALGILILPIVSVLRGLGQGTAS